MEYNVFRPPQEYLMQQEFEETARVIEAKRQQLTKIRDNINKIQFPTKPPT